MNLSTQHVSTDNGAGSSSPSGPRAHVVQVSGLTKRYGPERVAVENLSFAVHTGEVYGFLGPNGAGKTTTLKMLLGLINPSSGTIKVLDEHPGSPVGLSRVGALIESPTFYPYLSGYDNLKAMARCSGVARSRVDEVLKIAGLSDRGKDKFKSYSLGMKQRLGVACALLKDPQLLILDEPTNGLDPKGMADMRELIRELGQGECTVLLSSHLLKEVEQVCDRVGIIHRGKLVAEGTVAELRGGKGLLLRAQPLEQAAYAAPRLAGVEKVRMSEGMLELKADPARAAEINRKLVSGGFDVSELRPVEQSLEETFLRLTSDGVRGAESDG